MRKTPEQRQAHILATMAKENHVKVENLADELGVSAMSIRRDLDALVAAGQAIRTHGGAVSIPAGMITFRFPDDRNAAATRRKQAIADAATALVQPGMNVLLDTGSTVVRMAPALRRIQDLTVVTTSLAVASQLYACPDITLLLLGGQIREGSPDLMGAITEENLSRFHVDIAFLGADGTDRAGLSCDHTEVAKVSAAMLEAADRSVVLVDSAKFGHPALVRYARWRSVSTVVTDDGLPEAERQRLQKMVGQVIVVRS